MGPAGTVREERPQGPPPLQARRAPQALSVTEPGRDRVIHAHTSPPKPSCFRSPRAGVGNLARLARSAAPPGHPDGSRGQESSWRCAPRAARGHTDPVRVRPRCSRPRALRRREGRGEGCAHPGRPGDGPGGGPGQGRGRRLSWPNASPAPGGCRHHGGRCWRGGAAGRAGRRPRVAASLAEDASWGQRHAGETHGGRDCRSSSPAGQVSRSRVARVALRGGAVVVHRASRAEGCGQQLHGGRRPGGRWRGVGSRAWGPEPGRGRRAGSGAGSQRARLEPELPPPPLPSAPAGGRARAWRLPGLPRQREAGGARAAGARRADARPCSRGEAQPRPAGSDWGPGPPAWAAPPSPRPRPRPAGVRRMRGGGQAAPSASRLLLAAWPDPTRSLGELGRYGRGDPGPCAP